MSKYDFALDLENINSVSLIINNIRPKSKVLEFGSAHGRMTRYLAEHLQCVVDIVEIDSIAGQEAGKYARKSFIGVDRGNIEKFVWLDELIGEEYDFIIFADVLEHLYAPQIVLEKCKEVLKESGEILISLPNIAHNSVILGLINDEFKYTPLGLLDNTHIRFFTYHSFLRVVDECGLIPVLQDAIYLKVGENEIKTTYDMVSKDIAMCLKMREKGLVYQYIFGLKKKSGMEGKQLEVFKSKNQDIDLESVKCYIQEKSDHCYIEEKLLQKFIKAQLGKTFEVEFEVAQFKEIVAAKIVPVTSCCILRNCRVYVNDGDGTDENVCIEVNGLSLGNNAYLFTGEKFPVIELKSLSGRSKKIILKFEIVTYSSEIIHTVENLFKVLVLERNNVIAERDNAIAERDNVIAERDNVIAERDNVIAERDNAIAAKIAMENTRGWRLLERVRRMIR